MTLTIQLCAYILVMAGVTYLLRMLPMTLIRKRISSRFIRSVLYYLPYSVLSAMILPSVFYSTGSVITAGVGLAVALLLAFFDRSLITVAIGASAAAYITGLLLELIV